MDLSRMSSAAYSYVQATLQLIHRAQHTPATTVQHVGIDHRRLDAMVPQELLHGPNIIATVQ